MTPSPQQEYIITDEELQKLHRWAIPLQLHVTDAVPRQEIMAAIRSRPSPAPTEFPDRHEAYLQGLREGREIKDKEVAAIVAATLTKVMQETIESCSSEEPYVPNMIECGDCPFFILYDEGIDCALKALRTPSAPEQEEPMRGDKWKQFADSMLKMPPEQEERR